MISKKINYEGFRNIKKQTLHLDSGVNILYGENAQGKTNALEGIYLFAHGKSFRTQNDRDMVSFELGKTKLELEFEDLGRVRELSFELFKSKRRECKINKAPAKLSEMIGLFRAVLFCPDHLSIVKEGPSIRRGFINGAICQLKPVYMKSLQIYNKLLEQRNALIKRSIDFPEKYSSVLDLYSEQLSQQAAYIYLTRKEYIKRLDSHIGYFFEAMSNGESVRLRYKNSIRDEGLETEKDIVQKYYELFTTDRMREITLGTTLHGIHRDDIIIELGGKDARLYASQGQQRSIALALKLGEGEISKEDTGEYPIFLFDDVLSELDKKRQRFVIDELKGRQVVVTSCDISGFGDNVLSNANLICVKNGTYESV